VANAQQSDDNNQDLDGFTNEQQDKDNDAESFCDLQLDEEQDEQTFSNENEFDEEYNQQNDQNLEQCSDNGNLDKENLSNAVDGKKRRKSAGVAASNTDASTDEKQKQRELKKALATAKANMLKLNPDRLKKRAKQDNSDKEMSDPVDEEEERDDEKDEDFMISREKKRSKSLMAPVNVNSLIQQLTNNSQLQQQTDEVKPKRGPGRPPKYPRPNPDGTTNTNSDLNMSMPSLMSLLPLLTGTSFDTTAQLTQALASPQSLLPNLSLDKCKLS
jgi:hypothetical protein